MKNKNGYETCIINMNYKSSGGKEEIMYLKLKVNQANSGQSNTGDHARCVIK